MTEVVNDVMRQRKKINLRFTLRFVSLRYLCHPPFNASLMLNTYNTNYFKILQLPQHTHTDKAFPPQLQWESKIIRRLASHHKHWNADFGNNYNFRTGLPDTQIPREIKKIYTTFVLTTASEVIFAKNMDASAIYWPNFRHYSTSLTSSVSQAQRPTASCES